MSLKLNVLYVTATSLKNEVDEMNVDRLGIVTLSREQVLGFLTGVYSFPAAMEVVSMDVEEDGTMRLRIRHPGFNLVNEAEVVPLYALDIIRDMETGENVVSFLRDIPRLDNLKRSDRFDAEQAFMTLWTMFDHIDTIEYLVMTHNRKSPSFEDTIINPTMGLHCLLETQKEIAYQYDIMRLTSMANELRLDGLISRVHNAWAELCDGAQDYTVDGFINDLKKVKKDANAICDEIFNEMEAIIRDGREPYEF
jgi:hypothetical protein